MLLINDPAACCGCGACYSVCPNGSVAMLRDAEGFLYPKINEETCLHCGACERACPVIHPYNVDAAPQKIAYAARTKNSDVLFRSTSGGVAYELASYILGLGGVVYGAAYGENMQVRHQEIKTVEELKKIQGSKYVQSEILDTYRSAKRHLQQGRWVLFTGSPCQVEGLYAFLGKDHPTLVTMDFICHGVPSPGLWEQYLKETGFCSAKNILFREKSKGWENKSQFVVVNQNDQAAKKQSFYKNPFCFFFGNNYSLRPICYECPFKTGCKKSDFTVGDLWGISELLSMPHDDRGMSLMLLNSEKSLTIFDEIRQKLEIRPVAFDAAIAQNMMFLRSVEKPEKRALFFEEIRYRTFDRLYRKYRPKDPPILAIKKKLYPIKAFLTAGKK